MAGPRAVTVSTPSTIGNFGPGFDVTSLALAWGGDTLTATPADEDSVTMEGPGAEDIPTQWDRNCAAAAYGYLRERHDVDQPVHLHIEKSVPPGSGLGSSASSSAAGALAFARAHPEAETWDPVALVEAATFGESRVAGAHGDDVAAAILGGLALVRHGEVRRVAPPDDLHLAIVRPHMTLETKMMRAAVDPHVAVADALVDLANVAFLIDAVHRGDIATIARSLDERIATPGRRRHLPFFEAVRKAAIGAGAAGCAISGSGPAMFTVTDDLHTAQEIAAAMAEAVRATDLQADEIACRPEHRTVWEDELGR